SRSSATAADARMYVFILEPSLARSRIFGLPTVASGEGGCVSLEWLFTRNKILISGGQSLGEPSLRHHHHRHRRGRRNRGSRAGRECRSHSGARTRRFRAPGTGELERDRGLEKAAISGR